MTNWDRFYIGMIAVNANSPNADWVIPMICVGWLFVGLIWRPA